MLNLDDTHATGGYLIDKAQKKLALPLWVKLRHSRPNQLFHVLLTLNRKPQPQELAVLQSAGLQLAPFHQESPGCQIPGLIRKDHLEKAVLHHPLVHYIEGVAQAEEAEA